LPVNRRGAAWSCLSISSPPTISLSSLRMWVHPVFCNSTKTMLSETNISAPLIVCCSAIGGRARISMAALGRRIGAPSPDGAIGGVGGG